MPQERLPSELIMLHHQLLMQKGKIINVYVAEAYRCPDTVKYDLFINAHSNGLYDRLSDQGANEPHAILVSSIVKRASPLSDLHCFGMKNETSAYLNPFQTPSWSHVENYSWNAYSGTPSVSAYAGRKYNELDKLFDEHVYDNDAVVFVSAGN